VVVHTSFQDPFDAAVRRRLGFSISQHFDFSMGGGGGVRFFVFSCLCAVVRSTPFWYAEQRWASFRGISSQEFYFFCLFFSFVREHRLFSRPSAFRASRSHHRINASIRRFIMRFLSNDFVYVPNPTNPEVFFGEGPQPCWLVSFTLSA